MKKSTFTRVKNSLELTYNLRATKAHVMAYLCDHEKFVSVHPVIYRMKPLGNNRYTVYEKMKFGFVRLSFTYKATMTFTDDVVTIEAVVARFTKISMHIRVTAQGETAVVKEDIRFNTPLPITGLLKKIFREQHAELFSTIEKTATAIR